MKTSPTIRSIFIGLISVLVAACAAAPTPSQPTQPKSQNISATTTAVASAPPAPVPGTAVPPEAEPPESMALPAPVLALAGDPHDSRGAYALLSTYDLFFTSDRGLSWQALPFPPAGTGSDAQIPAQDYPLAQPDLVANTFQPGLLFASAADSLYRSRDAGQSWDKILDSVALFAVGYEGEQLFAWRPDLPPNERGMYRSEDGGETWMPTYRGLFPPTLRQEESRPANEGILSLAFDPSFGESLLVGTYFGVFRTFNGGKSWEQFNTGLPVPQSGSLRTPVLKVVGPINGDIYLMAETQDSSGSRLVLARLAHGEIMPDEDHWEELSAPDLSPYGGSAEPGFFGFYDFAEQAGSLYLATTRGVFASHDRGDNWERLPGPVEPVFRLGINPGSPEPLYAWTAGGLRTVSIAFELPKTPPALPTLPAVSGTTNLSLLSSVGGDFKGAVLIDDLAVLGVGLRLEIVNLAEPGETRLVGSSEMLPGVPAAIAAVESVVYVAIPGSGLLAFDLSDPSQPVEIARVELPFAARHLLAQGDRLFAMGGFCQDNGCSGGLAVLDLSDPNQPRLASALETSTLPLRIELASEIAYLYEQGCREGDCPYALRVVDISDPFELRDIAILEVPGPLVNLIIVGQRLLLAYESGLLVFDVSAPEQPRQTGRLLSYLSSFVVYGQYAYAFGLEPQVIDLNNPDAPQVAGTLTQGEMFIIGLSDALIHDQTLYALESFGEFGHCWTRMHVFDLSDPASPLQVNTEQDTMGFTCAQGPAIYKDWLVLADWNGVNFVDVSAAGRPRLQGSYPLIGASAHLAVQNGYVYVGNGLASDSLRVMDARESNAPVLTGPFPFSWAWETIAAERYLYIPSWSDGLVAADLGNPSQPVRSPGLDAEQLGGYAYRLALDGDHLIVALGDAGIRIVDVSVPGKPVALGSLDLLVGDNYIGADWLAAQGGFIYLVANLPKGDELASPFLVVVDARDPRNPLQVNQLDLPGGFRPAALHFSQGQLLLAGNLCQEQGPGCHGRFSVYDLSDPAQPLEVSVLEFPYELQALAEADGIAYLGAAPDYLLVLDRSNPGALELAAIIQTPGCAGNLAAEGRRLYLAACDAGLLIMEVE